MARWNPLSYLNFLRTPCEISWRNFQENVLFINTHKWYDHTEAGHGGRKAYHINLTHQIIAFPLDGMQWKRSMQLVLLIWLLHLNQFPSAVRLGHAAKILRPLWGTWQWHHPVVVLISCKEWIPYIFHITCTPKQWISGRARLHLIPAFELSNWGFLIGILQGSRSCRWKLYVYSLWNSLAQDILLSISLDHLRKGIRLLHGEWDHQLLNEEY